MKLIIVFKLEFVVDRAQFGRFSPTRDPDSLRDRTRDHQSWCPIIRILFKKFSSKLSISDSSVFFQESFVTPEFYAQNFFAARIKNSDRIKVISYTKIRSRQEEIPNTNITHKTHSATHIHHTQHITLTDTHTDTHPSPHPAPPSSPPHHPKFGWILTFLKRTSLSVPVFFL